MKVTINRFTALHSKNRPLHISLLCRQCNDIKCYNSNTQQDCVTDEGEGWAAKPGSFLSLPLCYRKTFWLIGAAHLFKSEHSLLSLQWCGLCLTRGTGLKNSLQILIFITSQFIFISESAQALSKDWRGGEKIWWKASFHCFSKLYCSLLILQASLYFLRYRFTFWDPPMPKFTDLSTCDVMVIWQSTQWKKAKYLLIQYSFWLLMLTTLQSPFTFPFVLDRSLCEHTVLAYSSCLF